MRRFAAIVLALLAVLAGAALGMFVLGCRSQEPSPPSWRWSEPYYAAPGTNVACGAGGKACE